MTSIGFSDQYIVLDSYLANQDTEWHNGKLSFNLAIQGFTTESAIGVNERLNRICEIEVEEFQFPADVPFIPVSQSFNYNPLFTRDAYGTDIIGPTIDLEQPAQIRLFDRFNTNTEFNELATIPSNSFSTELNKHVQSMNISRQLFVAVLPSTRTAESVTSVSPISDCITMYIEETGLQSISDLRGRRHNFNFRVSTVETTTTYNAKKRIIDNGEIIGNTESTPYNFTFAIDTNPNLIEDGTPIRLINKRLFSVTNESTQLNYKMHVLKPTKSMYIFTDPIIDISKLTLIFKNPDNPISMYPSVYYNVPSVFMRISELESITMGSIEPDYYFNCFIVKDHNLLPGDVIIVNNVTMCVHGSYNATTNRFTNYRNQLAKDIIVAHPLLYFQEAYGPGSYYDTLVTIHVPKRRIRVPLRLRRVVDRKTNSIISTS